MPEPDDWYSSVPTEKGSEFGGVPGLIQPPPHELTVEEKSKVMRSVPAVTIRDGQWAAADDTIPESEKVKD